MISELCANYSGVVVGVDAGGEEKSLIPSSLHLETKPKVLGTPWHYQTFRLPENYTRGTDEAEINLPPLSGFQLLVTIPTGKALEAELEYKVERYFFGSGWTNLASGTFRGCHTDGERVWMDVILEKPIPVDATMVPALTEAVPNVDTQLRIGFRKKANVENAWYTSPNPLSSGEGTAEDELATDFSFNFRILGLVADSGLDFLGNPYRSAVVTASAENPSGENNKSGFWLSSPQPSGSAVVSHYSDVRPFPNVVSYKAFNYVTDPSFEYDKLGPGVQVWSTEGSYWTVGSTTVKVLAWRGVWDERETYEAYEGVELNGLTYLSLSAENIGHNPEEDFGVHWEKTLVLDPPQGRNYLEVLAQATQLNETSKLTAINYAPNPSFEFNTNLWSVAKTFLIPAPGTLTRVAGGKFGSWAGEVVCGGAGGFQGVELPLTAVTFKKNASYTLSLYIKSVSGATTGFVIVVGNAEAKESSSLTINAEWKRYTFSWTWANEYIGTQAIAIRQNGAVPATFLIDGVQLSQGSSEPYFDGETAGGKWQGAAGESASEKTLEFTSNTPPFENASSPYLQRLKAVLPLEGTISGRAAKAGSGVFTKEISVYQGAPVTFSIWIRSKTGTFKAALGFGDNKVGSAYTEFLVSPAWTRREITLTPKAAGSTTVAVFSRSKGQATFLIDGAMVNRGSVAPYIDGDSLDCEWTNERGFSISAELIEKEVEDNSAVIDSVLIDPITPGVAFSIYYSNDLKGSEDGEPTIEQWEQKLWTRVPLTFITAIKETYALPEPIVCKFVKVEFSHLQAQHYDPGDLQNPVVYKRFPEWVVNPFIAILTLPPFSARKVGVSFDALELGYNYNLNDLEQAPESPKKGRRTIGNAANKVDPTTLGKMELSTTPYQRPPGARVKKGTMLSISESVINVENEEHYPVEAKPLFGGPFEFPVSGLERQDILIDQSMPVLYFFVTCRHEYQELAATFSHKRAYFAGLNEIAFLRDVYTVPADTEMYIESGGDTLNAARNDFELEELDWFVY